MSSLADRQQAVSVATLMPFLESSGYVSSLIQHHFPLTNGQTVPMVAFAHQPADARTACIAVVNADLGTPEIVAKYRDSAAPVVFVCGKLGLEWWQQTSKAAVRRGAPLPPDRLAGFFTTHHDEFAPDAIYRAKTWGRFDTQYQRSFVDLGLMPVVEAKIGEELTTLISRNVQELKARLDWDALSDEKGQWLLKCIFWLVSAKILRDKGVGQFGNLDPHDVERVLDAVAEHYGAGRITITSQRQRDALAAIGGGIAEFSSLQLATTESLAYVYENALISKATRQSLGTHSTPPYLVDYAVGKLAPWIADIPVERRNVFEPACGHAAFLVSAMRLLTELLPDEPSPPSQRRRYLRKRIHGCDIDDFALEIARLSLSLTDIPNPDGWDLVSGDMFLGDILERQARTANVVLANPPFENFRAEERDWYGRRGVTLRYVNKTAEMLGRVLPELTAGAVIGVIVPQGFLHSKNATAVRRHLIEEFELREICLFPDKVFTFSDMESAVLIARKQGRKPAAQVRYRRVRERAMCDFRNEYRATLDLSVKQSSFQTSYDLRIPDLGAVWDYCRRFRPFQETAEIGQGFTFKGKGLPPGTITFSDRPFPGAVRGFLSFNENIALHELPREVWLNLSEEAVRRPGHGTTTGLPQVLLNEAPSSRGAWRLKALIDSAGHPVTGRFNVVRPRGPQSLDLLWALCNSPIANAYAFSHSGKRHNDAGMLRDLPMPELTKRAASSVSEAARRYLAYVRLASEILQPPPNEELARELLLRVDNEVLKLYSLPRELEWQLLDYFAGWGREGIPFTFDRYFPEHFSDRISLADYLAITADWSETNRRRDELIRKKVARTITALEQTELEHLQSLASSRVRLLAPLPLENLQELHREVVGDRAE